MQPRLQLLCEGMLKAVTSGLDLEELEEERRAAGGLTAPKPVLELPPCTLARDLGALVCYRQYDPCTHPCNQIYVVDC